MKKEMKSKKKSLKSVGENIYNIPNGFTLLRVLITFIAIYLVFAGAPVEVIILLFVLGMITDTLDGQIARRFNMKTEFGRKFDMIADRFLLIGIASALLINLAWDGLLTRPHVFAIMLVLSREILALPVAFVAFITGRALVQVRVIGKITTVMQAFAFPSVILNIYYPSLFFWSIYLAIATAICGVVAAFTYISDVMTYSKNERA